MVLFKLITSKMPEDLPKEAGIAALIAAIFIFVNLNFGCFYDNDCLHLKMHLRRLKIIERFFFLVFCLLPVKYQIFLKRIWQFVWNSPIT